MPPSAGPTLLLQVFIMLGDRHAQQYPSANPFVPAIRLAIFTCWLMIAGITEKFRKRTRRWFRTPSAPAAPFWLPSFTAILPGATWSGCGCLYTVSACTSFLYSLKLLCAWGAWHANPFIAGNSVFLAVLAATCTADAIMTGIIKGSSNRIEGWFYAIFFKLPDNNYTLLWQLYIFFFSFTKVLCQLV